MAGRCGTALRAFRATRPASRNRQSPRTVSASRLARQSAIDSPWRAPRRRRRSRPEPPAPPPAPTARRPPGVARTWAIRWGLNVAPAAPFDVDLRVRCRSGRRSVGSAGSGTSAAAVPRRARRLRDRAHTGRTRNPTAPRAPFLLTFWCGPPLAELDDARAAEIAAAGFTVVGTPCQGGFDADAEPARARRRAAPRAAHVGARPSLRTRGDRQPPDWPAPLQAAVARLPRSSGAGRLLRRRRAAGARVRARRRRRRRAARRRPASTSPTSTCCPTTSRPSLLGAPSYDDYVEQFITTVHPRLLSYDYYPFGHEKDRSTLLRQPRRDTRRRAAPRPAVHADRAGDAARPYRDPSEAELAWQVHHALAYGARGISYFTYWTPPSGGEWNNRLRTDRERPPDRALLPGRATSTAACARWPARCTASAPSPSPTRSARSACRSRSVRSTPSTAGRSRRDCSATATGGSRCCWSTATTATASTAQLRLRAGAAAPQTFDVDTSTWQAAPALSFVLPPGRQPPPRLGYDRRSARMTRARDRDRAHRRRRRRAAAGRQRAASSLPRAPTGTGRAPIPSPPSSAATPHCATPCAARALSAILRRTRQIRPPRARTST